MDDQTPIKNHRLKQHQTVFSTRGKRRGFGVAPILYMLGLIGVGAGILFSSYSQTIRTNIAMTNSLAVKGDIDGAATTLAATSILGATDPGILCPPQGGVDGLGTNCANAPVKMTEIYPVSAVAGGDVHLPANYLNASGGGTPVEVGVFTPASGTKQLDPWGHYYIYCRWESAATSTVSPAIMIISAGADGTLQTNCGATTSSGDDTIIRMDAANAVNRSSVWQTGTAGTSTPEVYYGSVGHQLTVDANGNLTVPGDATVMGNYSSPSGNITLTGGTLNGNVAGGTVSGSTGAFSSTLAAEGTAFSVGAGGSLSATAGNFLVNTGGALSAAAGNFTVGSGGDLAIGTAFTVAATGVTTIGSTLGVLGTITAGTAGSQATPSLITYGAINIGTTLLPTGSSVPYFTVGKAVGTPAAYPFSVDQAGNATAGSFNGTLNGSVNGGTVTASSITDNGTLAVTGNYTSAAGNITLTGGTVTAANFVGNIAIGTGGGTFTGVMPILNGGTGASDATTAISNLTTGVTNTIPGAALVNHSVTTNQLNTTGVTAGTYNSVTVTTDGRITVGSNVAVPTGTQITDGSGESIMTGTSGLTYTVGSSTVGFWNSTGLMVGTGSPTAANKLDVDGGMAIGTNYAGVDTAPANGLIVVGSVGIGTSSPSTALQVVGTITATAFSGSGAGLTGIGTGSITGILAPANGGTGTGTAFTAGSIVFAGASGNYAQDNANFFWDATNHKLGIGTNSMPAWIGTGSLQVANMVYANNFLASGVYGLGDNTMQIGYGSTAGTGYLTFTANSAEQMRIGTNGISIGTATTGNSKIQIWNGEVQVGSSGTGCSSTNAGAIRYNGNLLYYCDGVSTWQTLVSSGGGGGALGVPAGGTGDITLTAHSVLVGEGTSPVGTAGPGATGTVLIGNGASTDPSFSTSPSLTNLTLTGTESIPVGTTWTTATASQDNVALGAYSTVRFNAANAVTFTGIGAGSNGQLLYLHNPSAYTLTLSNNSGSSLAANRIITGIGADLPVPANTSVTLQYDGTSSLWRVTGSSNAAKVIAAGTDTQIQYNNNGAMAGSSGLVFDYTNQNLGIGTTTPTPSTAGRRVVDLYQSGTGTEYIADDGTVRAKFGTNTTNSFLGSITGHPLYLITSNNVRMAIDSFGNVGIGTNAPGGLLDLQAPSTSYNASSGNQNILNVGGTINQSGTAGYTALSINPTESATGSGTDYLVNAQVGGTQKFYVSNGGTGYFASNVYNAGGKGLGQYIANDTTTGVTTNMLAKLTAVGSAIITATTDTDGIIGVVNGGSSGTSGNSVIVVAGQASCVFDGATTAGDYVVNSITTNGKCHDGGTTRPTTSETIGQVLTTHASGGTYAMTVTLQPSALSSGAPTGTGTTNYAAIWKSATTLGTASLYDNGTAVGIHSSTPGAILDVVPPDNGGTDLLHVKASASNGGGGLVVTAYGSTYMNGTVAGWDNNVSGGAFSSSGGATYITSDFDQSGNDNILLMPHGTGKVGIGTTTADATLTIKGSEALMFGTDYSTTGANQADVALNTSSSFRYTGAGTASFAGIVAGTGGQLLTLINASSNVLTLNNQDTANESTLANRIITGTGAPMNMPVNTSVTLTYDGTSARWRVTGASTAAVAQAAGSDTQIQYNNNGVMAATSGLVYDYTNTRVGIGTATPTAPLSINFTKGEAIRIDASSVTANNSDYSRIGWYEAGSYRAGIGMISPAGSSFGLTFTTMNSGVSAEHMRLDYTGNLGIGTTSPGATLTVNGTEALLFGADYSTTGLQQDVALNTASVFRYTGAGTATFYGIVAGTAGQILYLHNASSSSLTVSNQSTSETTLANRVITGTGIDMVMLTNSSATLQYDGAAARWRVIGGSGGGIPAGTTGQVQFNSGANTFAADSNFYWDNTNKMLEAGTGAATPVATTGTVAGITVNIIPQAVALTTSSGGSGGLSFGNGTTGQMAYYNGASSIVATPNLYVSGSNIGIGTSAATNLLSLDGTAARTMWMERGTTVGNNLTLQAGGGLSGGTNENGGNLILSSGITTGTGTSKMQFNVYPGVAGATADNTATTAMTILSSGYVGIGTTGPNTTLDVESGNLTVNLGNSTKGAGLGATASGSELKLNSTGYNHFSFLNTLGNLEIGTSNASYNLGQTVSPALTVLGASGNVGIGATLPVAKLTIEPDGVHDSTNYGQAIQIDRATTAGQQIAFIRSGNKVQSLGYLPSSNTFGFGLGNSADASFTPSEFAIDTSGYVGIGTASPTTTLHMYNASNDTLAVDSGSQYSSIFFDNATVRKASVFYDNTTPTLYIQTNVSAPIILGVNGGNQLNIATTGNVGIGTTSSLMPLQVGADMTISANWPTIGFNGYYNSGWKYITTNSITLVQQDYTNAGLGFFAAASGTAGTGATLTEAMLIKGTGQVDIGTTGTSAPNPGIIMTAGAMEIGNNAGAAGYKFVSFERSGVTVGSISQSGTAAVLYNTTSDRRLKENIAPTKRGLDVIGQITVDDFNYIAEPGRRIQGFIAQDLYKVYPEAVTVGGDDAKTNPWSVDYGRISPLIIKAVQELKALFDKLEALVMNDHAEIAKLKSDNDNFRAAHESDAKSIDELRKDFESYKKAHK